MEYVLLSCLSKNFVSTKWRIKVHFDSLQTPATGNFARLRRVRIVFSIKFPKQIWKTKPLDDKDLPYLLD